ncbi:hypothetical protein WSM22_39900 [Cytophagales bacterium WSM2-2]|nr:hypothetical protein WSM22_39900 [Cytophagales bacterium WSM2-2]
MELNSTEFLLINNEWNLQPSKNFSFYSDKTISQETMAEVIAAQELNWAEIANLMALEEEDKKKIGKINFWVFADKKQKARLTKVNSDAHAINDFPSVYYLPKNAKGGQEVGHILTQRAWGFMPKTSNFTLLIEEGFNYYIDEKRFYREGLYKTAKAKGVLSNKQLDIVTLATQNNGKKLVGAESGSHGRNESFIAGAFAKFLCEQYGMIKYKLLWQKACEKEVADISIFSIVYGKTLEELNKEFVAKL